VKTELETDLELTPTPELYAYRWVTSASLAVDGETWLTLPYGVFASGRLAPDNPPTTLPLRVSASCLLATPVCGNRSICRGSKDKALPVTFELRAHVAGAASDPEPVTFEIPIDCSFDDPQRFSTSTPSSPTDQPNQQGTAQGVAPAPGGSPAQSGASGASGPEASAAASCAISRSRAPASFDVLAAALGAALILRRRRKA
jgi:hypothetical protein